MLPKATAGRLYWLTPDRFDKKPDKSTWLEMARWLRSLGWSVEVVASYSRDADRLALNTYDDLVRYVWSRDIPFVFRILTLISTLRYLRSRLQHGDVIVVNQDSLWLKPFLSRIARVHIHLDIRTLPVNVHGLKRRLDSLLFWRLPLLAFSSGLDGYSFITKRMRLAFESEFHRSTEVHSVVWQSGVNMDLFQPQAGPKRRDETFVVLYHGSISIRRGLGNVLKGLAVRRPAYPMRLVIVGDGPDREELQRECSRLKLDDIVTFRGYMPYEHVVQEIVMADVCICPLPDYREWEVSSPLKVLEYMACEKPMILTPIGAHLDIAQHEPYVVWTRGYEPVHYAEAVHEAWERRAALLGSAVGARERLRGDFDWESQARKLDAYLTTSVRSGCPVAEAAGLLE